MRVPGVYRGRAGNLICNGTERERRRWVTRDDKISMKQSFISR